MKIILSREKPRRLESLDYFGFFSLAALLVARVFPFDTVRVPLCGFKSVTGWPCPGCGMTTCYILMMHGQPLQAMATSPAGAVLFVGSVLGVVYVTWRWLLGGPELRFRFSRAEKMGLAAGAGFALLANWIYLLVHSFSI